MREAAQDISCVPVPWEPGAQACGPPEPQVPGMSPEQQPQRQPLEMDKLGHPDACRSSLLGDSDTLCMPEGSTKVAHSEKKKKRWRLQTGPSPGEQEVGVHQCLVLESSPEALFRPLL